MDSIRILAFLGNALDTQVHVTSFNGIDTHITITNIILYIFILYYFTGVATFCRHTCTPIRAEEGLAGTLPSTKFFDSVGYYGDIEQEFSLAERKELDAEGRAIITQHDIKVHLVYRRQKRKLDIQENDLYRCLIHC